MAESLRLHREEYTSENFFHLSSASLAEVQPIATSRVHKIPESRSSPPYPRPLPPTTCPLRNKSTPTIHTCVAALCPLLEKSRPRAVLPARASMSQKIRALTQSHASPVPRSPVAPRRPPAKDATGSLTSSSRESSLPAQR